MMGGSRRILLPSMTEALGKGPHAILDAMGEKAWWLEGPANTSLGKGGCPTISPTAGDLPRAVS